MTPMPNLPETAYKPLTAARLDAMVDLALSHPQMTRGTAGNVVSLRRRMTYMGGMTAMAASILMAFMVTPQISLTGTTTPTASGDVAAVNDVGDYLLLESLGA